MSVVPQASSSRDIARRERLRVPRPTPHPTIYPSGMARLSPPRPQREYIHEGGDDFAVSANTARVTLRAKTKNMDDDAEGYVERRSLKGLDVGGRQQVGG